jgi:hypothetical protein
MVLTILRPMFPVMVLSRALLVNNVKVNITTYLLDFRGLWPNFYQPSKYISTLVNMLLYIKGKCCEYSLSIIKLGSLIK